MTETLDNEPLDNEPDVKNGVHSARCSKQKLDFFEQVRRANADGRVLTAEELRADCICGLDDLRRAQQINQGFKP